MKHPGSAPDDHRAGVHVVIPCYRESRHILDVLKHIPNYIQTVYVVDDACPENTGELVSRECHDPRVRVLRHEVNQGVGAAVVSGYRAALEAGARIVVKLDGDGQMNPELIHRLLYPLRSATADYAKGNRFFRLEDVEEMPAVRLLGNAVMSFLSKLSTGYWRVFDPTNGFTAIHASVLRLLPLDKIDRGYYFETDMLFRLNTLRAVVVDVPMRAHYGAETSSIRVQREAIRFTGLHLRNFAKRIFYNYFLRDFHVSSLEWILGPAFLLFGLVFGITEWIESARRGEVATAGTVMLAGLPIIVGLQLLLAAINFDITNRPEIPLHRMLDDNF